MKVWPSDHHSYGTGSKANPHSVIGFPSRRDQRGSSRISRLKPLRQISEARHCYAHNHYGFKIPDFVMEVSSCENQASKWGDVQPWSWHRRVWKMELSQVIGIPPVIIHFRVGFSMEKNIRTPSSYWSPWSPWLWTPPFLVTDKKQPTTGTKRTSSRRRVLEHPPATGGIFLVKTQVRTSSVAAESTNKWGSKRIQQQELDNIVSCAKLMTLMTNHHVDKANDDKKWRLVDVANAWLLGI